MNKQNLFKSVLVGAAVVIGMLIFLLFCCLSSIYLAWLHFAIVAFLLLAVLILTVIIISRFFKTHDTLIEKKSVTNTANTNGCEMSNKTLEEILNILCQHNDIAARKEKWNDLSQKLEDFYRPYANFPADCSKLLHAETEGQSKQEAVKKIGDFLASVSKLLKEINAVTNEK